MAKQGLQSANRSTITVVLFIIGAAGLLVSAFAYWHWIYTNPSRVFDRMLRTSLSSSAVTKTVNQSNQSQGLVQTMNLTTQPLPRVHSLSVLTQGENGSTKVTTETVATPKTDFVRYTEIKTDQKNAEGKTFDFSKVIGVWGKTEQSDSPVSGPQQFNQTLLGIVPIANMSAKDRGNILGIIHKENVYSLDKSKIKRESRYGRPVYIYQVTIKPAAYVRMLKAFAQANGLKQLDQVDPEQYAESTPLTFTLEVDILSGQLTKLAYADGQRTEVYSSYGTKITTALPTSSISVDELQSRLQNIR